MYKDKATKCSGVDHSSYLYTAHQQMCFVSFMGEGLGLVIMKGFLIYISFPHTFFFK